MAGACIFDTVRVRFSSSSSLYHEVLSAATPSRALQLEPRRENMLKVSYSELSKVLK